jgi:predicted porin
MMHKKSLAALVATLFAVPFAAHADVTIYGFLSSSIESTKATGATAGSASDYKSRTRVVDDNSRIGFKGNEDLGNGTKAIWQVESSLKYFEQGGTNDKGETATLPPATPL